MKYNEDDNKSKFVGIDILENIVKTAHLRG